MTLGYILAALFLLGVLIMMHELGHYLVARWLGIEVKEFAIGMGPKVWSRKGKRDTLFSLRALPLGGFCLYYGEDEEVDDPRAYNRQPVWMRFLTVLAGPVMNFLLALVVAVVFFMAWGLEAPAPVIGELRPASPAVEAGLMPGDRLLAIGGVPITQPAEASALVRNSGGKPLEIAVGRGEETLTISVAPHYNEERQSYLVGIEGWAAVGPVPVIGELDPALPAAEAGLMPGDAILAIDGVPIAQAGEIAALVGASEGAPLRMTVGRGTEMLTVLVEPRYSEERQTYQVGILRYAAGRMPLPFGQAISSSVVLCRHVVVVTYQALTGAPPPRGTPPIIICLVITCLVIIRLTLCAISRYRALNIFNISL